VLEQSYIELFYHLNLFTLIPVTSERMIRAAKTGAENGLKLIDALHYYTALETECEYFVTNDARFKSSPSLKVLNIAL
jgi:predicted nucleic acid-binding protein